MMEGLINLGFNARQRSPNRMMLEKKVLVNQRPILGNKILASGGPNASREFSKGQGSKF